MQDKAARILAIVIVASVLALIGTGVGMAVILRASGTVGTQPSPPNAQATPALGVMQVSIRNYAYQPATIEVVWGTAVSWTNADTAVHSVVLPHIIDSETDIRESGPLSRGQSFTYTFFARGTFQYYCAEHPNMVGSVIVT
jgi:plastocyanin